MSDMARVFALSKRPLTVLGASVLAAAALLVGSYYGLDAVRMEAQNAAAQAQGTQDRVAEQENDLRNVQTHIQRFQELRALGLMGEAQRVVWLEQLQQAWSTLGLAQELRMELKPAQTLLPEGEDADPAAAVYTHDLVLETDAALETDIVSALERFRHTVKGRFRVQECRFSDAKSTGMLARCTLRFVTIADAPVAPSTP